MKKNKIIDIKVMGCINAEIAIASLLMLILAIIIGVVALL